MTPIELCTGIAKEVMSWHDHDGFWCYSQYHHPIGFRVAVNPEDPPAKGFFRPDQSYFQMRSVSIMLCDRTGAEMHGEWKVDDKRTYTFEDEEYKVTAERPDLGTWDGALVVCEALLEFWRAHGKV